ncbi:RNA polymerase sigma-70 factor (ECF subfamily) [Luteibacter sp. Sphag1AF]|uniref:RNA polymerase sigma factor n=1 Tax=Luteibacter sp. Sphag1AF TaxID=2587031 RepID=UPI0016216589|nr:sigma-70 family RNA polymerase sigma factor [Luteibacter sp. Sphag1AF]MBB3227367.1 RNA polymerase sigma-70 factor (ECF subfamily) [Luteibacter sp. Sphag1AF]
MRQNEERQRRFAGLLTEHRRIVFKVARVYARGEEDRRDLEQDIVLQLWRAFPRYDDTRRFSTWMYRIALNVALSGVRRDAVRPASSQELDDQLPGGTPISEPDERVAQLYQAIGRFEPLDRALLLLYLDDRPHADMADVLGLTVSHVGTKIGRLKERLRREMTDAPVNHRRNDHVA